MKEVAKDLRTNRGEPKSTDYWITADGQKVRIDTMSNNHLNNSIKMLERKGLKTTDAYKMLERELNSRPIDTYEDKPMKMNLKDRLLDRFFRKVDNVVWDLMSGQVGVRTKDGIVTFQPAKASTSDDEDDEDATVTLNPLEDFGIEIPAFAQDTPVESLQEGDLIVGASEVLGWITKKKSKSFELLKPGGTFTRWSPPKTKMIGFSSGGAMVLRSLLSTTGGENGLESMQSNLLPIMMMSNSNSQFEELIPLMLMSQGSGDTGNMMQTMMMMKLLGGKSGSLGFFEEERY